MTIDKHNFSNYAQGNCIHKYIMVIAEFSLQNNTKMVLQDKDCTSDRLIGNVSVMYVTLISWRRERRRHVPSPRLLYNHWVAGPRLSSSVKTWICAAPASYLYSRCDQQTTLVRLIYTQSEYVSLSEIPIRRSYDVTSLFPPSGNKGYIRNRDVLLYLCYLQNLFKSTMNLSF